MNITFETSAECQASLRAEVSSEDVHYERETIIARFAQQARLPGYRKGRVPRRVIEKRFEKKIRAELEQRLLQQALSEAIEREHIHVLQVQKPSVTDNLDLTYTVTADLLVAPRFELTDYKGIQITLPQSEVREDHIERVIDDWRDKHADFTEEPEGTRAAMGHYLQLDYKSRLEGEAIPPEKYPEAQIYLSRENGYLHLDETSFLPGFCGELLDHGVNETFDFTFTLPDDFPVEELKGRELAYTVTIRRILKKTVPELTDDTVMVMTEGQVDSVEKFRENVKKQLELRVKRYLRERTRSQCLVHLQSTLDFELPEALVLQETQHYVDRIVENNQRQGVDDDYLIQKEDEIVAAASQLGRRDVKGRFILEQVAEKEGIKVSEREVLARVAILANQAGISPKKALSNLKKSGGLRQIGADIVFSKTLDFIGGNASVQVDEAKNALDEIWENEAAN